MFALGAGYFIWTGQRDREIHPAPFPRKGFIVNRIKTSIRISEINALAITVVRLYRATSAESETVAGDANLASLMDEVDRISAELSLAIKRDRAESMRKKADDSRDEVIRNLSDLLTGYAAIPVAEKRAAARRLLPIFQKYGRKMANDNYSAESGLIESLLGDITTESAKADSQLLEGVDMLISSLRAAEDQFRTANDAFIAAKAIRTANATKLKADIIKLINGELLSYLSAVKRFAAYKDFIAKCSLEIDRANALADSRTKQTAEASAENAKDAESDAGQENSGESESSEDGAAEEESQ